MANARNGNVIYVDTTGYTLDQTITIYSVKYLGNALGTAVLTVGTSGSGMIAWQEAGTANLLADEICARLDGIHVALTNGAKVLIYLDEG